MGGVSKRSFKLFQELCGDDSLKNVVIATNMWNKVTLAEGEAREKELKDDERFFKHALNKKARLDRHDNTLDSARQIISKFFTNRPMPLAVQKELVDEKMYFLNTSVGKGITRELQEMIRKQKKDMGSLEEELAEAKRDKDKKAKAELMAEKRKSRMMLARFQKEIKNLSDYHKRRRRAMNSLDSRGETGGVTKPRRFACF
jgi:hypothetical protein